MARAESQVRLGSQSLAFTPIKHTLRIILILIRFDCMAKYHKGGWSLWATVALRPGRIGPWRVHKLDPSRRPHNILVIYMLLLCFGPAPAELIHWESKPNVKILVTVGDSLPPSDSSQMWNTFNIFGTCIFAKYRRRDPPHELLFIY